MTTMYLGKIKNLRIIVKIYQVYKWLVVIPLIGLVTTVLTVSMVPVIRLLGQRAGQLGGIWWARINSFATPMSVSVKGREHVDKNQSYVVVANHQSQYDIFAVYGWLPVDFRWVLKQELRNVPVLGYYCHIAGHVYIDRSNTESALASIQKAKKRITNGTSIFFFPEGTRSESGELLPFKKGAFKFALDLSLPILPVTISGTREVLPANTMRLFPGNASVTIHEPIPVEEYSEENIDELIEKASGIIARGLN